MTVRIDDLIALDHMCFPLRCCAWLHRGVAVVQREFVPAESFDFWMENRTAAPGRISGIKDELSRCDSRYLVKDSREMTLIAETQLQAYIHDWGLAFAKQPLRLLDPRPQ